MNLLIRPAAVMAFSVALAIIPARAATFTLGPHTFTVPDGFEVEFAAAPPLVQRPVSMSFDEQGRLYVTESSGSNAKVEVQLREKPHRILRLEDTDGDGKFDRPTVFATQVMFPEGAMWRDGALYVAAPPSLWKFTDTNGDGVSDQREEWFLGKTLTGCANDLHGPYPGLDGWIYWCKGAFAKQTNEVPGRPPFITRASHIFRARPDGSGVEPVFTAGMDNPVAVEFTPEGERLLAGTFLVHPEAGRRDGIVHAVYGGIYGKPHDVLDGHPKTGELMPIMKHLGPAAPCALRRYDSPAFGPDFTGSYFCCLFNLHKVTCHTLEPNGATFKTRDLDFLVSDNADFHPTDVLEDADGSLLVIDTGGWYKLCCPTSQLAKPDVLGGIYRIRRRGAPKVADPRGLKLAWNSLGARDLTKLLDDARPAVQQRAIQALARLGSKAIQPLQGILQSRASTTAQRNAVWALTRIDGASARAAIWRGAATTNASVRQAAIHSASVWRDAASTPTLTRILATDTPALQRAAAEALGRLGDPRSAPALLDVISHQATTRAKDEAQRVLEHSLIYALFEIGDRPAVARGLASANPQVHRAALIALDQLPNGGLAAKDVAPLLAGPASELRDTAMWIVGHHPEWGQELSEFYRARLLTAALPEIEQLELQQQLRSLARSDAIQAMLGQLLAEANAPTPRVLLVLDIMAQANLKDLPAAWVGPLQAMLARAPAEPPVLARTITALRALPPAKAQRSAVTAALVQVAGQTGLPAELRLAALAAAPETLAALAPELFALARASLDGKNEVRPRQDAARILGHARLSDAQLLELTDTLKTVGPMEMGPVLDAFERCRSEAVGLQMIAALKTAKALNALRPDQIKAHLTNFPDSVRQQSAALLALLNVDEAAQQARLETLLAQLKEGDIRRGQALFNSPKAACSTCHAMGYLGGKLGPDLTTIGQIRTERDLLESIVYPSASFVRSYEPVYVRVKGGEDYSGILRADTAAEVVLATGPDVEVRVPREEITEVRPGTVSVMPAGFEEQLTRQELADLLAFLKGTKRGAQ